MKILLAGMNVDIGSIEELLQERTDVTPETISAAYARISRDPRPINELRKASREEVEKARKSNQTIIYGLGHSSIAEHAVFNIDLIGISRLAVEEIEKCRLASYTEKSQRYITLEGDYITPEEIKNTIYETSYHELVKRQNKAYNKFFDVLKPYFEKKYHDYTADKQRLSTLEGWAKEDARYVLSLATEAQLGMTINARNLERMISRLSAHQHAEIRTIAQHLLSITAGLAPSLIKYTKPSEHEKNTRKQLTAFMTENKLISGKEILTKAFYSAAKVSLNSHSENIDTRIAAALCFTSSNISYTQALETVTALSPGALECLFKKSLDSLHSYDPLLREFENAEFLFEMEMSASCFAQMKRHRMATLLTQDYSPKLGYVLPHSLKDTSLDKELLEVLSETQDFYSKLVSECPLGAEYILPNAAKRRVLLKVNLRELHHISRLREDAHSQWEIREVAAEMTRLAREKAPLSLMLTCGKDAFDETRKKLFEE